MSDFHGPISVIIPAHNESVVIDRCINTILDGTTPEDQDRLDIIIVCNGCTDDTADRARAFGPPVRVIELEQGSKPLALNTGDQAAAHFPRIFVDADIDVTAGALFATAAPLADGTAQVSAPALMADLSGCSPAVRRHYRVWTRLPYVTDRMVGSGIYALSEQGRARFDAFPNIIGDDAYIRRLFKPKERASVFQDHDGAPVSFSIHPPRTLGQLVHIETRRKTAADEMVQVFGPAPDDTHASQRRAILGLAINPMNWLALATYLWVKAESRRRFRARKARGEHKQWLRDDSSRQPGSTVE